MRQGHQSRKKLQCLDIASFRQSQRKLVGKGAIDFGLGIVNLEPHRINHLFSHCRSMAGKLTKKPSCFVFASSKVNDDCLANFPFLEPGNRASICLKLLRVANGTPDIIHKICVAISIDSDRLRGLVSYSR